MEKEMQGRASYQSSEENNFLFHGHRHGLVSRKVVRNGQWKVPGHILLRIGKSSWELKQLIALGSSPAVMARIRGRGGV